MECGASNQIDRFAINITLCLNAHVRTCTCTYTCNSFGQFSIRMCSHRCPIGVQAMVNVRAGKTKAQVGSRIKKI